MSVTINTPAGQEIRVRVTWIIGTNYVVYSAWEPTHAPANSPDGFGWAHGTITRFDDDSRWWGEIHSRELPAEINALPARTYERSTAVRAWHNEICAESKLFIETAFPHLTIEDGRIYHDEYEITETFLTKYAARHWARSFAPQTETVAA